MKGDTEVILMIVFFFLGLFIGSFLGGAYYFPAIEKVLAPMFAAGFGAWAAFSYQSKKDEKETAADIFRKTALQIRNIREIRGRTENIQQIYIDAINLPGRHVSFPLGPEDLKSLVIPFEAKDYLFLLENNNKIGGAVFAQCDNVHGKFQMMLEAYSEYSTLARKVIPNAFDQLGLNLGDQFSVSRINQILGETVVIELESGVDAVVQTTNDILDQTNGLDIALEDSIRSIYPKFKMYEVDSNELLKSYKNNYA